MTMVGERRLLPTALLVFVGYLVGAELGFAVTFPDSPISMLWAPNAILLAAFLLTPTAVWPALLAAALPAHLLAELRAGVPLAMVLGWFTSNASEALIGAACVRRFAPPPLRLDRLTRVGVFLVSAALVAPLLSSFLDAGLVSWIGWGESSFWEVWRTRVFSNTLANVTIVPVILTWSQVNPELLRTRSPRRYVELAGLSVGLVVVSILIFGRADASLRMIIPGLLYAPLPFLIWAAVRFGPIGVSTSLLFAVSIAIWNAVHGRGPFTTQSPAANALAIQLLFTGVSATLLALAAVVDERRRAQEEARQSSEQLRLALDAAQMSAWSWPIAEGLGAITNGSSGSVRAAGRTGALARWLESVLPEDRAEVRSAIHLSLTEGVPYEKEFRVAREDGSYGWMLSRGNVLLNEGGEPARLIGIHVDVTERKSAEALSTARHAILEMMIDGAPLHDTLTRLTLLVESEAPGVMCSVLTLDADGVHVHHCAAPTLSKSFVDAVDGLAIGPEAGSCGSAMYYGRPVITTDILTDALWNDYRDLAAAHGLRACWSTPLFSRKGTVLGSFALYNRVPRGPNRKERDLVDFATQLATLALERHVEEAEAEEQRREVAHLGRVALVGGLSGALAHELSQPLAAILSDAQAGQRLLSRDPPELDEIREILDDIVFAQERAGKVLDRLRGFLAKRHDEFERLDMNGVLTEALQLLRSGLRDRQVLLIVELNPDLPPVMGDRVQLIQVLLNLLMNACEAMTGTPPSERLIRVATWSSSEGSVYLSVSDRGAGIPRELVGRVGEPFVTTKPKGLGLGLSISRSILAAHGGGLRPENNPDRGATFLLVLPPALNGALVS